MPKIIIDPIPLILKEAKDILLTHGYDGFNMRDIAKQSGIGTGTIYNYFPKKEDLLIRLMIDYWNELLIVIDTIDISQPDFYQKLYLVFQHFNTFTHNFHAIFLSDQFKMDRSKDEKCEPTNKKEFMDRLHGKLADIIIQSHYTSATNLTEYEIAEFIVANFIAISYSNSYPYQLFEKVLKSLLT